MSDHRPEGDAARVLVVDGDPRTRRAVAGALREAGFATSEVGTAGAAERAVDAFRPDLITLETTLPDADGLELAPRLVARRRGTHLILLSPSGRTADKVAGLAIAADYVTKPFSPAEIAARARAILRRTLGGEEVLRVDDLVLNPSAREVERAGTLVELTPREFELLRFFMLNPGRVVSKLEILEAVWGYSSADRPSVVETYVGYLRRKLDRLGPPLIHTVRLVGYALRVPEPGARYRSRSA